MKDKNTFLMYRSDIAAARRLMSRSTADSALEFLFAIADYSLDQVAPTFANPSAEDAFLFADIQRRVDADIEKYTTTLEKRRRAGQSGGIASGEARSKTKQNKANEANASNAKQNEANAKQNEANAKQNEANEDDTVSVSVPVSVPVPVPDIPSSGASPQTETKKRGLKNKPSCIEEVEEYAKELSANKELSGRPNKYYGKGIERYAEPFFLYWEGFGWIRRGSSVKDWKALFRNWCLNEFKKAPQYSNSKKSDTEHYVFAKDLNVGDVYDDPNCMAKVIEEYNATYKS